jgi:RNA polymerase sigma-70 factor (family 1)
MMAEDYSDERLLKAFNAGDPKAFEAVFNRYWSRLVFTAFNIVRDFEEARDITSKTMDTLYTKKPNFEHINQLHTYLFLVTRNKCIDYLRLQKIYNKTKEAYGRDATEVDAINDTLDVSLAETLLKSVDKLPERARHVVVLYYLQGMKYREIAEEMKITERTVESHLREALKRLRISLHGNRLELGLALLMISLTASAVR